jgi:hypothetical protein
MYRDRDRRLVRTFISCTFNSKGIQRNWHTILLAWNIGIMIGGIGILVLERAIRASTIQDGGTSCCGISSRSNGAT